MKRCDCCGELKPLTEFHKCYSKRRNHCAVCRSSGGPKDAGASTKLLKELGLSRPPLGTPSELSARTDYPLVLDHEHGTKNFRGWITDNENKALASFGDDLEGVVLAVLYMLKAKTPSKRVIDECLIPLRNKLNEIIN